MSKERPSTLYHGSSHKEINRLEPSAKRARSSTEGPKVFATPDKRLASVFIAGIDDSWGNSGVHNGTPYLVISDRKRFETLDTGGAIYHVPSDTFETDPHLGLGELEWTSGESIEPIHKEEHESALEAMLHHGVQVFFVDKQTYNGIQTARDHGLSVLQRCESENQRRNINPVAF